MKNRLFKTENAIIVAILALLGFSTACSNDNKEMYASPYAEYEISSRVTDQHSNPIPGIQLDYFFVYKYIPSSIPYAGDQFITDANGAYLLKEQGTPVNGDGAIRIVATDIDGELNGLFKTTQIDIPVVKSDFKGGDGWNRGKYVAPETVIIAMEEDDGQED